MSLKDHTPINLEGKGTITHTYYPQRTFSRWYWFKWRVAGRFFPVPESLASAWYSQGCPTLDDFDVPAISFRERLNWRLSMWLRESKTWRGWSS